MPELLVATYVFPLSGIASAAWKKVADTCPGLSTNRWRLDPGEPGGRHVTVIGEDAGPEDRASFERAVALLASAGEPVDAPDYVIEALVAKRARVTREPGKRVVRHAGGIVLHPDGTQSPLKRPQG